MHEKINNRQANAGSKTSGLQQLQAIAETTKLFSVPSYISFATREEFIASIDRILQEFERENIIMRSDSADEDTAEGEKAGYYKSLRCKLNEQDLMDTYNEIQNHAEQKGGSEIGVIVQEYRDDGIPAVAYTTDPSNPHYMHIALAEQGRMGADVADGKTNAMNLYILKTNIPEYLLQILTPLQKAVYESLTAIDHKFPYSDVEFQAYQEGKIVSYQRRDIATATIQQMGETKNYDIPSAGHLNPDTVYANDADLYIGQFVNSPKNPPIARTFFTNMYFSSISPVIAARKEMGYADPGIVGEYIGNDYYIDIKKRTKSFLPNTLTEDECKIFETYYCNLIKQYPELQHGLILSYHPKSLEIVLSILNGTFEYEGNIIQISDVITDNELREQIKCKFKSLIGGLSTYFEMIAPKYMDLQNSLLHTNYGLLSGKNRQGSFSDLLSENFDHLSLEQLINYYTKVATHHAQYGRGKNFYPENMEINQKFYDAYLFSSQFNDGDILREPNGFDFMNILTRTINKNTNIDTVNDIGEIKPLDICLLARENLKFIFLQILRGIGQKIDYFFSQKSLSSNEYRFLSFNTIVHIVDSGNMPNNISQMITRAKTQFELYSNIKYPTTLHPSQNFYFFEEEKGKVNYQISHTVLNSLENGTLACESVYLDTPEDAKIKDIKGRIVIVREANTEYDHIVHPDSGILGVVALYGNKRSHLGSRCEQRGIPLVSGIASSLYESIKKHNGLIKIDFINENLSLVAHNND